MVEDTYTVSELGAGISRALHRAFPDEVWVRGEIRNLKRHSSGHVYFTLVDPEDASGPAQAGASPELHVVLFASDRDAVNRRMTRSPGAMRMTDGVEVRIRGGVRYHAARGTVRFRMTWIDPDYTIGRLAVERDRILRALEREGLLAANGALPYPDVPLRVGLVTSRDGAAYADFVHELESSGYGFSIAVCDVRVQGVDAERSILGAFRAMRSDPPDVVALVRGGGAQTDLAVFDSEAIARAIARFPAPVIVGIGHEIDTTVADAVAARSFKTPTACAASLVADVAGFLAGVDQVGRAIGIAAARRLAAERRSLDASSRRAAVAAAARLRTGRAALAHLFTRMAAAATASVARAKGELRGAASAIAKVGRLRLDVAGGAVSESERRLVRGADTGLAAATRRTEAAQALVAAHDPARLFARGWSVTRDGAGRPLRSVGDVSEGDAVHTTLADGTIDSSVTALHPAPAEPTIEPR